MKTDQQVKIGRSQSDYAREGLDSLPAVWEDGLRTSMKPGTFEWWYFDVHLENDIVLVIIIFTKPMTKINNKAAPFINVRVSFPDGSFRRFEETISEEHFFADSEKCDIRLGDNEISGDLDTYHISINIKSISCKLTFKGLVPPWRPGNGKFYLGENNDHFFGWLVPTPRAQVEGEYILDGISQRVIGQGYHDHNWGNISLYKAWNHWWWSRVSIGNYTVLALELTATKKFGYSKLPLLMLANKDKIVLDDVDEINCYTNNQALHSLSKKSIPRKLRFSAKNENLSAELELVHEKDLFIHDFLKNKPIWKKILAKIVGLNPWYFRIKGEANLSIINNGKSDTCSGPLVYEFMSFGSKIIE